MSEYYDQIPEQIKDHIKDITKTSGMPNNDESLETMSEAWLEKKNAFEREIESLEMEEIDFLNMDDDRGALIMTYSGSLINIGPKVDNKRNVEYNSIGLRNDVPNVAEESNSELSSDITIDEEIDFKKGPVRSTSAVFKIAVCKNPISVEDEANALNRATMILTKEFTDINKTYISNS